MWFAAALAAAPAGATPDRPDEQALKVFAVHIDRTPKQSWPGYGIYLGDGLILTASHVVDEVAVTRPKIVIDGLALPAFAVKEGLFDTVDLTLLSIEPRRPPAKLEGRRLIICETTPQVGDEVIVAIPEGTTRTWIASAETIPLRIRIRFDTLVANIAGTGNSGSGVFDADSGCLLGIISRKIELRTKGAFGETSDKYYVPAPVIRDFIPKELGF